MKQHCDIFGCGMIKIIPHPVFVFIQERMGTVEGNVSEIRGDVRTLMGKGSKRWDSVVEKTLLVAVGAIVAWILGQIGL